MKKITLVDGRDCGVPCGYGIECRGEIIEIFQTDWDFPFLARLFGYSGHRDAMDDRKICQSGSTDETVDCECGATVSEMIQAAQEYLDNNCGKTVLADE